MLKYSSFATFVIAPVLLAGCATSVQEKVENAEADAPTWYEEQKADVLKRGYPDLSGVPEKSSREDISADIIEWEKDLDEKLEALKNDPKAMTASEEGREDPSVWAQRKRDEIENGMPKD